MSSWGFESPTCALVWAATSRLSPVIIFTRTPRRFRSAIVAAIPALGGS